MSMVTRGKAKSRSLCKPADVEKQSQLIQLPPELISAIILILPAYRILTFRLVCRTIYDRTSMPEWSELLTMHMSDGRQISIPPDLHMNFFGKTFVATEVKPGSVRAGRVIERITRSMVDLWTALEAEHRYDFSVSGHPDWQLLRRRPDAFSLADDDPNADLEMERMRYGTHLTPCARFFSHARDARHAAFSVLARARTRKLPSIGEVTVDALLSQTREYVETLKTNYHHEDGNPIEGANHDLEDRQRRALTGAWRAMLGGLPPFLAHKFDADLALLQFGVQNDESLSEEGLSALFPVVRLKEVELEDPDSYHRLQGYLRYNIWGEDCESVTLCVSWLLDDGPMREMHEYTFAMPPSDADPLHGRGTHDWYCDCAGEACRRPVEGSPLSGWRIPTWYVPGQSGPAAYYKPESYYYDDTGYAVCLPCYETLAPERRAELKKNDYRGSGVLPDGNTKASLQRVVAGIQTPSGASMLFECCGGKDIDAFETSPPVGNLVRFNRETELRANGGPVAYWCSARLPWVDRAKAMERAAMDARMGDVWPHEGLRRNREQGGHEAPTFEQWSSNRRSSRSRV